MKKYLLLLLTLAQPALSSGFFGGVGGGGGGSDPNKWDLTGNSGTDPASNFIGSNDAQDIVFKANSSERFKLLEGSVASRITGTLQFKGSTNSNTVGFIAPVLASSYSLTLPTALPGSTLPLVSTLGGTMSFSLIDVTSMLTGVLPLANGGTNKNITPVVGSIPYIDADSFETLAPGTSGHVLTTQGAGLPPIWAATGGGGGTYTADGLGIEVNLNQFSLELADTSLTKSASGLAVDWALNPYKGQYFIDAFTGDNSTTAFVLSQDPISENNTIVYVSGVYQAKANYSVSGTTLTFSTAPPSGTANIEVITNIPLAATVVGANSIGTVELQDDAVYTANILNSAVTSAKIADGTIVVGDLADGAVTSAKILDATIAAVDLASDSVSTAKIIDSNVTTAKIADDNVTTAKILNANVTNAKLAADAVTTAKILDGTILAADLADGAVTSAKILDGTITSDDLAVGAITAASLPAANYVVSSSSGTYIQTNNTYATATNLSVSLTTNGRPVVLELVADGTSAECIAGLRNSLSAVAVGDVKFRQDSTDLATHQLSSGISIGNATTMGNPCSIIRHFYTPAAGTYTYTLQAKIVSGGTSVRIENAKLVAREL